MASIKQTNITKAFADVLQRLQALSLLRTSNKRDVAKRDRELGGVMAELRALTVALPDGKPASVRIGADGIICYAERAERTPATPAPVSKPRGNGKPRVKVAASKPTPKAAPKRRAK